MENGFSVRLPVATAAGSVDDCVLKYAPNGQPSQQVLRYWQLAAVVERLGDVGRAADDHAPVLVVLLDAGGHVLLAAVQRHRRQELAVGQLRQALALPLMPANFSTWLYHGAMSV